MSLFLKQNDHYIGGVYFLGNCGEDFTKKIVWYCFVNKKIVVVVGEFFFVISERSWLVAARRDCYDVKIKIFTANNS